MNPRLYTLSLIGLWGCFQPPGDLCSTDIDCPNEQQCVTLDTRSVCLDTRDHTGLVTGDAGGGQVSPDGGPVGDGGTAGADAGSTPPETGAPVVALGADHSCAVSPTEETLKCWGGNDQRQLGLDAESDGDRFIPVSASGTGVTAPHRLAAGSGFTCGVFDQSLWCWGRNPFSQDINDRPWQVVIPDSRSIRQLAAGRSHYCALFDDGQVACAGNNDAGQIGQAKGTAHDGSLVVIADLTEIREIGLGGDQSCALTQAGDLKCWGKRYDHHEAQGEDTGELRSLPQFGAVTSLAVGATHLCALDDQGLVRCLGDNTYKQIDMDVRLQRSVTELAALGIGVEYRALSASRYGTCALSSNQTVYCWGQIAEGDHRPPELVPNLFNVESLFSSPMAHHRCAQLADDDLMCWGQNDRGQLGRGHYEMNGFIEEARPVPLIKGGNGIDPTPGTSCRQIHEQYSELPSGRYLIDPLSSGQATEVYCDMERGPGGWTLLITVPSQDHDLEGTALEPPVASYPGSLWSPDYRPVSLPADFAENVIAYRSPAYSLLSYGFVSVGFRAAPVGENWSYWSFRDSPRASLAAVIDPGEFVGFGEAGLNVGEDGWCSLVENTCGWGSSGDDRGGYNSLWNGTGVRIGFSARQDQPSCGPAVPVYMGIGGSSSSYVAGISRNYSTVSCNSSCCGQNRSYIAHGQLWVR